MKEDLVPPDEEGVEPLGATGDGVDVVTRGVLSLVSNKCTCPSHICYQSNRRPLSLQHGRLGRLHKKLTSQTKMQAKQQLLKQLHALAKTKKANRKAKKANKITDELVAINKHGRWKRVEVGDENEWEEEKGGVEREEDEERRERRRKTER